MSVIFEALKKIGGPSASVSDTGVDEPLPANVYTIRQLIFSPQGFLGLSLFILLVGGLSYYGADYLGSIAQDHKSYVVPSQGQISSSQTANPKSALVEDEKQLPQDVPPEPKGIAYKKAEPGKLFLPGPKGHTENIEIQDRKGVVYLPPGSGIARSTDTPAYKDNSATVSGEFSLVSRGHFEEKPVMDKGPDKGQTQAANESVANNIEPSSFGKGRNKELKEFISTPESEIVQKQRKIERVQQRQVQESWEKTAAMSRLVSKLQRAMVQNDQAKVEQFLEELEKLKGSNDPFLIKLKAFWQMKKGNYSNAVGLLERVLVQRPNDCEAGLNMAIIEIRTGNVKKARERLKVLERLYPTNTNISEILRKING